MGQVRISSGGGSHAQSLPVLEFSRQQTSRFMFRRCISSEFRVQWIGFEEGFLSIVRILSSTSEATLLSS
jgi:hypothetical protein